MMKKYTVLYRQHDVMSPFDDPFGFECMADDTDHAEEQCLNAYPDADIVWVCVDVTYLQALNDYHGDSHE